MKYLTILLILFSCTQSKVDTPKPKQFSIIGKWSSIQNDSIKYPNYVFYDSGELSVNGNKDGWSYKFNDYLYLIRFSRETKYKYYTIGFDTINIIGLDVYKRK